MQRKDSKPAVAHAVRALQRVKQEPLATSVKTEQPAARGDAPASGSKGKGSSKSTSSKSTSSKSTSSKTVLPKRVALKKRKKSGKAAARKAAAVISVQPNAIGDSAGCRLLDLHGAGMRTSAARAYVRRLHASAMRAVVRHVLAVCGCDDRKRTISEDMVSSAAGMAEILYVPLPAVKTPKKQKKVDKDSSSSSSSSSKKKEKKKTTADKGKEPAAAGKAPKKHAAARKAKVSFVETGTPPPLAMDTFDEPEE